MLARPNIGNHSEILAVQLPTRSCSFHLEQETALGSFVFFVEQETNLASMTPLEAITKLYELQKKARS